MAVSTLDSATGVAGLVSRHRALVVRTYDVLAAVLAWPLALLLRQDLSLEMRVVDALPRDVLLIALLALVLFELTGVHRAFWRYATAADLAAVALGALALAATATLARFLLDRLEAVPRAVPILFALLTLVLLVGARIGWMLVAHRATAATPAASPPAAPFRPVLLVGAGEGAALAIRILRHAGGPAYRAVGILDPAATRHREVMGVPVLGRPEELRAVLASLAVRGLAPVRILVTADPAELGVEVLRRLSERARVERLPVSHLRDLVRLPTGDPPVAAAASLAPPAPLDTAYLRFRRRADALVAALGLALAAVPMLVIAAALRVVLGPDILFRQVRSGRGFRPFILYKFRTLAEPVDADGRDLAEADRHNPFGRFLRRFRLDELPQLWNVLKGDMALIGPRPLVEAELAALPDGGRERARLRPGLTGWAQVNGGAALGPLDKHALDLWYIRHAGPALDARILARTLRMMLCGERVNEPELRRALAALRPEGSPA